MLNGMTEFLPHFSLRENTKRLKVQSSTDPWERKKNEGLEFMSSVLDQMFYVSATLNWFPIVIGFATDIWHLNTPR